MSKQDRLIVLGVIKGAHGVRGDVRVKSFMANPEDLFAFDVLLDEHGAVALTPKSHRPAKDHFIVRPAEQRQKEDWDALKGTLLYVPRSALPDAEEDEFYVEDLVGVQVFSVGDIAVGQVKAVHNFGADDLLEIHIFGQPGTVFVPFTKSDVPFISIAESRVIIPDLSDWAETPAEE